MTAEPQRRILVIDDNRAIHEDFAKILERSASSAAALAAMEADLFHEDHPVGDGAPTPASMSFDVAFADQGQAGAEMVTAALAAGQPYAVAFVDMRMPPGWDGIATIRKLWEIDPELQCVICTAYSDYSWEDIVDELGVSDKLLLLRKPFDAAEVCQLACALTEKWQLARRAGLQVERLRAMVDERTRHLQESIERSKLAEEQLRHDASHDSLTGLANRALLSERLSRCVLRQERDKGFRYAVMFIDLDRFKLVNDSLGHGVGDSLLVAIARRLTSCLRAVDTVAPPESRVARLGGDEFVVLLEGIRHDADAMRVAERILASMAEPIQVGGHTVHASLSIGIALGHTGYQRAEDVLRDADTALYRAKTEGRGRYGVFTDELHVAAMKHWQTENALREAIAAEQFTLRYQPILSLENGRIAHFEALVRWNHPDGRLVMPGEFIAVAEESGLIVPLGSWVLGEACRQAAAWREQGLEIDVAVNVASKQFAQATFVAEVERALARVGLPPTALHLEVTEGTMMDRRAMEACAQLAALGVRLHLDDFGTGYSSLSYLTRMPVHALKLDRSFVCRMLEDPLCGAVAQTVLTLASALGLKAIAEGVETEAQAQALCAMGCPEAQGFLWSKPVDVSGVLALMAAQRTRAIGKSGEIPVRAWKAA